MTSQIQTATPTVTDELKAHWGRAIELWLNSRRSPSTRRTYAAALEDLLATTNSLIWELERADVIAWAGKLRARGLSDCTIAQRLAGVSSFFRFAMDEYTLRDGMGREIGLTGYNPAGAKSIRPRIQPYGKSTWLSPEEARALLGAIRRRAAETNDDQHVRALRDYALILGYLMTGRRNSEWRQVRRGDFEGKAGAMVLRWSGKGKTDQRLSLPQPVWSAISAYLAAAQRESIGPNEYIFIAVHSRSGKCICSRETNRILKGYCRPAGLDPRAVHVHTLRHSAAMLRKEAGDSIEDNCAFLGHSSLAVTQIYTHTLEGRQDRSWGKVADLLGI